MQDRSISEVYTNRTIMFATMAFGLFLVGARMIEALLGVTVVVASFGAATVVMFALNGTDAAKPYNVFLGHVISLVVGLLCSRFIYPISIDAALFTAVIGTLVGMKLFRCVHPPGGAVAMILVLTPIEGSQHYGLTTAFGIVLGLCFYSVVVFALSLAFRAANGRNVNPDVVGRQTDAQRPK